MSAPTKQKTYFIIFGVLALLTAVEVGVARPELGIGTISLGVSLVGLALAKAALVAWFFMHLNHERKALKLTVLLPFLVFSIYPLALIAEATWRRIS